MAIELVHIETSEYNEAKEKIKKYTNWTEKDILKDIYPDEHVTGTDLIFAIDNGQVIGMLNFIRGEYAQDVWVDDSHRRQGIATKMYDLAEKKTKRKLKKHPLANESAENFWKERVSSAYIIVTCF